MRDFRNLGSFATYLAELEADIIAAQLRALVVAGEIVKTEAKAEIGTYQDQVKDVVGWAELAYSTKDDRVRQGYTENDPLLRDGTLRDSIESQVEMPIPSIGVMQTGSPLAVAEWQEMGTPTIPPRSFLAGAIVRKTSNLIEMIGARVVWALRGLPISRND